MLTQHFFQQPRSEMLARDRLGQLGKANSAEIRGQHAGDVVDDQGTGNWKLHSPRRSPYAPGRDGAVGAPHPDASMLRQPAGRGRTSAAIQVAWTADHDQTQRRREPHGDHVGGDEFAHAYAGVETVRSQVAELRVGDHFDHHFRIRGAERRQYRLKDERNHRARHRQAQQA